MLRLTEEAAAYLKRLRNLRHAPDDAVPRFERQDGRLRLVFARGPSAGDHVVNGGPMAVVVAQSARDLLESATIELRESAGNFRLAVKGGSRPATASSDGSPSSRASTHGGPGQS